MLEMALENDQFQAQLTNHVIFKFVPLDCYLTVDLNTCQFGP